MDIRHTRYHWERIRDRWPQQPTENETMIDPNLLDQTQYIERARVEGLSPAHEYINGIPYVTVDTSKAPPIPVPTITPNAAGGIKFDSEKPRWSLMPVGVIGQVVEVLTFGARKYAPDNWKKIEPTRYYDALQRHLEAFRGGEKRDPESGKHHLAHALCCLIFMLWHDDNPQDFKK